MKKIAITQRIIQNETFPEIRDALDIRWAQLFSKLNILPVIIPNYYDPEVFLTEINVQGVILSGGNDLFTISNDEISKVRDTTEQKIINYCSKNNIPLLGICRGMQLLGHTFGGQLKKSDKHVGTHHQIKINNSSRFANELSELGTVNSYHNWCIEKIPSDFVASAFSEDGFCEAMEHKSKNIFAQMWHPERETEFELQIIKKIFNL